MGPTQGHMGGTHGSTQVHTFCVTNEDTGDIFLIFLNFDHLAQ